MQIRIGGFWAYCSVSLLVKSLPDKIVGWCFVKVLCTGCMAEVRDVNELKVRDESTMQKFGKWQCQSASLWSKWNCTSLCGVLGLLWRYLSSEMCRNMRCWCRFTCCRYSDVCVSCTVASPQYSTVPSSYKTHVIQWSRRCGAQDRTVIVCS